MFFQELAQSPFYRNAFYFLIYAIIGWLMEVAYAAVNAGKFVNRGFLNGPYCPIYGFGFLVVKFALGKFEDNILILALGSFLFMSLLEFFVGWILEKIFHNRWWDYSGLPFNIGGYVCLKFSLAWTFCCLFVLKIFHPFVATVVGLIPGIVGFTVLVVAGVAMVVDSVATVQGVLRMNRTLRLLSEIALLIRQKTETLGKRFSKEVLALKRQYESLVSGRKILEQRHLRVFPGLRSIKYERILQEMQERLSQRIIRNRDTTDKRSRTG
jgi:uncharacterized membrane protein